MSAETIPWSEERQKSLQEPLVVSPESFARSVLLW
jgi:hypothetical protein